MFFKRDLMTYFNKHFPNWKYTFVNKKLFPAVCTADGYCYYHSPDLITHQQSFEQYSIEGLEKDDIVIDLGANIGAFSMRCARSGCGQVYAFEPIVYKLLWDNIHLNNLQDKIWPSWLALGNGHQTTIEWMGFKTPAETRTMTQLIEYCKGCDFLKCDTEGAEWLINPDELKDVRRIEMEFHMNSPYANETKIEEYNQYFNMVQTGRKGETLWYSGTNKYV